MANYCNKYSVKVGIDSHAKGSSLVTINAGAQIYFLQTYLNDPAWPRPNLVMLNNALTQTNWLVGELTETNWREQDAIHVIDDSALSRSQRTRFLPI